MPRLSAITPNDLLGQPDSRRLVMRLSPDSLTVWIGDPTRHSSSVFTTITLPAPGTAPSAFTDDPLASWAPALEETIYANPLLLDPYLSVDIIIDAPDSLLSPAEQPDASVLRAFAERLLPPPASGSTRELLPFHIPATEADVVISLPLPLLRFLRRSFQPLRLHSTLSLLSSHALSLASTAPVILVNCHDDAKSIDLVIVDNIEAKPQLISASTIQLPSATSCPDDDSDDGSLRDAIYYITAAAKILRPASRGFSPDIHVVIAGNASSPLRPLLLSTLPPYTPSLSPAPFPPGILPLGTDVTLLPFDLTIFLPHANN